MDDRKIFHTERLFLDSVDHPGLKTWLSDDGGNEGRQDDHREWFGVLGPADEVMHVAIQGRDRPEGQPRCHQQGTVDLRW
jgi:hypothetical protein